VGRQDVLGEGTGVVMVAIVQSGYVSSVVCDEVGRRVPGQKSRRKTKYALNNYPFTEIHAVPGGSMGAVGMMAE
jgi:hypothetical protein